jgi:hypothetical protein
VVVNGLLKTFTMSSMCAHPLRFLGLKCADLRGIEVFRDVKVDQKHEDIGQPKVIHKFENKQRPVFLDEDAPLVRKLGQIIETEGAGLTKGNHSSGNRRRWPVVAAAAPTSSAWGDV